MKFDVVIVGAGPAGLACAAITAAQGASTLVLERKPVIGRKVCAGGITWNGLMDRFDNICQKEFSRQRIITRYQNTTIEEPTPIIATVNRIELGQVMAEKARIAGAVIQSFCRVNQVAGDFVTYKNLKNGQITKVNFLNLVGADGSISTIRKHLKLPVHSYGVGINYQLPVDYSEMEWHLDSHLFGSGYAWIFPHKGSTSVGVYGSPKEIRPIELKKNLYKWAESVGFTLEGQKAEAEIINFDYQGYEFDNIYLAGDAAGLASGLTGEGIYPAIVCGEEIGRKILTKGYPSTPLQKLIQNHERHSRAVKLAGTSKYLATVLGELTSFCLKKNIIHFSTAEMAR